MDSMTEIKVTDAQQKLIEHELRRGTSRSRIANLLEVSYEEGVMMIEAVQENIRPEIGDKIRFKFRGSPMTGIISKLLTNSAVVDIYWQYSDEDFHDVMEDKTIVNFKDIIEFISLEPQEEDKRIVLESEPEIIKEADTSSEE